MHLASFETRCLLLINQIIILRIIGILKIVWIDMLLKILSLPSASIFDFIISVAVRESFGESIVIVILHSLSLLHGWTSACLESIDPIANALFLQNFALSIWRLQWLHLSLSFWLSSLEHGVLSHFFLSRFFHSLQLFLFVDLLALFGGHLSLFLLLSHLGGRGLSGDDGRVAGRNWITRPSFSTRLRRLPQVPWIRHQFRSKRALLPMPLKLIILLRLVRLVNLALTLIIKLGVPRLLILIE